MNVGDGLKNLTKDYFFKSKLLILQLSVFYNNMIMPFF